MTGEKNVRTMHLFAGHGGGLLADLILGHTPIVAVEWDRYACQVLRERAADGWFPGLSVWEGDVRLFDPSEYTGRVDCIHAGFPCQDISVAGKQAGVGKETRSGLYREVLRIAGVVRPRQLFLENVSAIVSNGLGTVLADLATLGYDCEWLCLRASDCGANHHRDRWWLLANSNELRPAAGEPSETWNTLHHINRDSTQEERGRYELDARVAWLSEDVPDANRELWSSSGMEQDARPDWRDNTGGVRSDFSNSISTGLEGCGASFGVFEEFAWSGRTCWWSIEPELGRVANGVPNRVEQLKGYGNAQVPLQAAVAYRLLGGQ